MDEREQIGHRNRRAAPRRGPRGGLRFFCRKGALGLGADLLARVSNISETGASVHLKAALALNDEVEFSIEGYGLGVRKRLGTIVWITPQEDGTFLAGIRFRETLSYADLQTIARPI